MRKFHSAKVLYRVSPDPIFLGAGGARLPLRRLSVHCPPIMPPFLYCDVIADKAHCILVIECGWERLWLKSECPTRKKHSPLNKLW